MRFDPSLMNKINKQEFFKACKMVGWKRPDKVPIHNLIPKYLDKVERLPKKELTAKIVDMYNNLVTTLGMDQDPPKKEQESQVFPNLIYCFNCKESWDVHKSPLGIICEKCIKEFMNWTKKS